MPYKTWLLAAAATFCVAARSRSARDSATVSPSGRSLKTCFPARIAAPQATPW